MNGLGYYVVLWHKVKGNSHNNNNNNNNNDNDNDNNNNNNSNNNNNNTIHLKFTLFYLSESCVEFRAIFSQAVKKARLTVKL